MADHPDIRVKPPLLLLAALLTGGALSMLAPMPLTRAHPRRLAGLPLLTGGLLLAGTALRNMRKLGTTPNPTLPVTALVTNGPYRFTRNPMYLSFTLLCLGIGMLANSLWFIPLAGVLAGVLQTQVIRYEEGYLENKFGSDYRAYKNQVRRWI